jgi:hypothetical protein
VSSVSQLWCGYISKHFGVKMNSGPMSPLGKDIVRDSAEFIINLDATNRTNLALYLCIDTGTIFSSLQV